MARIIEKTTKGRRTIQLSTDDIISIVQEYQQLAKGLKHLEEIRNILENNAIFIPESN